MRSRQARPKPVARGDSPVARRLVRQSRTAAGAVVVRRGKCPIACLSLPAPRGKKRPLCISRAIGAHGLNLQELLP